MALIQTNHCIIFVVHLGHFTWCNRTHHHRFFTPCYKAKTEHWVSSHLHLPGCWWHNPVSVQPNLLEGAALGDVAVNKKRYM